MNEPTWRTYLDDLVHRMKPMEKQRLLSQLGVTRTTLLRWRTGVNTPDATHVERLLDAVPAQEREHLLMLMQQDSQMRGVLPSPSAMAPQPETTPEIPSRFYADILRLQRDTPDRFWQVCGAVLQRALMQLETSPKQSGMELLVARCMPPAKGGKVRSLRAVGLGSPPWRGDLHTKEYFLGAESLAGYVVSKRRGEMIPNLDDAWLPVHHMDYECSAAAYPILHENCVAGALLVSSTQVNYFSRERLALLELYADLVRLAFYDAEFYPSCAIDLGFMPAWTVQQHLFRNTFRQRIEAEYKQVLQAGQMQELTQIEERVLHRLEEELLQLANSSP